MLGMVSVLNTSIQLIQASVAASAVGFVRGIGREVDFDAPLAVSLVMLTKTPLGILLLNFRFCGSNDCNKTIELVFIGMLQARSF